MDPSPASSPNPQFPSAPGGPNVPAPSSASRLPAALRAGLADYARAAAALCGPRLACLSIFGAALTPDWRAGRTVHQVMVFVEDDLDLIGRLGTLAPGAITLGLAAPLLIPQALIATSRDTFPLEWLEIMGCHEVLFGCDCFTGLTFTPEHVRLQCERECAVLGIALRQRLLRGDKGCGHPLVELAEHVLRVLGGLLYLEQSAIPSAPSALLAESSRLLSTDLSPILRAWNGETGRPLIHDLHRLLAALEARSDRA